MKFGSTKGLLGVLVLVACAQPSAVFGQAGVCHDVEVKADGYSKSGYPDAMQVCYNELKALCKKPHKLDTFEEAEFSDEDKSTNGTYSTVECWANCSCRPHADPIIPETKPASDRPNTVPADNK